MIAKSFVALVLGACTAAAWTASACPSYAHASPFSNQCFWASPPTSAGSSGTWLQGQSWCRRHSPLGMLALVRAEAEVHWLRASVTVQTERFHWIGLHLQVHMLHVQVHKSQTERFHVLPRRCRGVAGARLRPAGPRGGGAAYRTCRGSHGLCGWIQERNTARWHVDRAGSLIN